MRLHNNDKIENSYVQTFRDTLCKITMTYDMRQIIGTHMSYKRHKKDTTCRRLATGRIPTINILLTNP